MKLLIYQWNSYFQYDIYAICRESGITFQVFEWKFESKNRDDGFRNWFRNNIKKNEFDAVLSVNYFPVISEVCMEQGLKYIAWCYDNPLNVERIEETLGNPVNYVFVFDKVQFWQYAKAGFETVYYLPLGVNATRLSKLKVSEADYQKYAAEVTFIGNLYASELQGIMGPLNDYTKGYLKSLMDLQSQIYGYYLFDECITEELIKDINQQYLCQNPNTKLQISKEALSFAMASEVTRKERLLLLNLCGRRYSTKFYSYDDCEAVQNVIKCGSVDYVTEMPKVFACSKINLNPSLRIIQSGIPLRALDIMGCGGFLLSNYQQELAEYYVNEEDMVIYESMEDAIAKIDFYLKHEELRCKIAENGRRKTLEEHSMQVRMAQIFDAVGI
ncbi:MAG: glycosyltransferase [Lachnospiraceae bacterium]|nr:glycosyltransferase [Lachnospiraceae bacterium]